LNFAFVDQKLHLSLDDPFVRVTLKLDRRALSFYDVKKSDWRAEAGDFTGTGNVLPERCVSG